MYFMRRDWGLKTDLFESFNSGINSYGVAETLYIFGGIIAIFIRKCGKNN